MGAGGIGQLTSKVAELGQDLSARLDPADAAAVNAACSPLSSPLELGVAGRVNSGKSTLVNALVGRRVARTDARECTRLVTAFSYGEVEGVSLLLTDGDRIGLPLSNGQLPDPLPVENERVRRIDVALQNKFLRDLTVIDTPGLASTNDENSNRTLELLVPIEADPDSNRALSHAEAIIYVYTQSVRSDDREMLRAFRDASATFGSNPGNAVGILNKVDLLNDDDPLEAGRALAEQQASLFSWEVSTIVPVIGLLAETVETGRWNEHYATLIHQLGGVDDGHRSLSLKAVGLFLRQGDAVSEYDRGDLLERLGLHGIRIAVEASLKGSNGAVALARTLMAASGFSGVRASVDSIFHRRADAIKAAQAVGRIGAVADRSADLETKRVIGDALETLMAQRELHKLQELDVLSNITNGQVRLPDGWLNEAVRLINGFTPGEKLGMPEGTRQELIDAAQDGSKRWKVFAVAGASPEQEQAASTLHRSYFYLWGELTRSSERPEPES
jgi:GTPase SAR1 family protein